ncbi:unnamed protein product [Calypogeia fissa]
MANSGPQQLPKCKYGSLCYRTNNADHRMEFWHPESLSNTRTNGAEEQSPDAGAKDGAKTAISFQPSPPCASNFSLTHVLEGVKTGEIDECGPKHSTTRDAAQITPKSLKPTDAGVLLLLIGVPGSGKSTFCAKLMSNAAQPWTRICQDIIAKGKKGTRKECLKQAGHVLAQKGSVVIDRCNIDKGQRSDFLQLAASFGVEAHGVVLNLPQSVCIQRASKRIGHEGGVHAGNAGSVINRFASTRQPPVLSEGFSRITFCRTDMDVEKVVQEYRELLPSKHLESGVFGAEVGKNKNALQSVLGKGFDQRPRGNNIDNKDYHVEKVREDPQQAQIVGGREKPEPVLEAWSSCRSEGCNTTDLTSSVSIEDKGASTLAFPSISTSDFQFDHENAATVVVEEVAKFLITEDPKMRLVLVDLKDSHMLSLVSRKAREQGLDPNRFLTFVGDITKLRTSRGPACNVIANAANWRLKAGGGGVNAAIYSAAGPDLERATKKVAQTIDPGTSVAVQLPEPSPKVSRM